MELFIFMPVQRKNETNLKNVILDMVGCLDVFYGISILSGYLKPNLICTYIY